MRSQPARQPCTSRATQPPGRPRDQAPLAITEARATLTVEEAATLLGIGRTAAYEADGRGQLPTRRLAQRLLVPVPALLDWLGAPPRSAPDLPPPPAQETR